MHGLSGNARDRALKFLTVKRYLSQEVLEHEFHAISAMWEALCHCLYIKDKALESEKGVSALNAARFRSFVLKNLTENHRFRMEYEP